jgi:hypothetical protein
MKSVSRADVNDVTEDSRNSNCFSLVNRVAWLLLMLFLCAVVCVDAVTVSPYNLVSLAGLVTFVLFSFLFSARPGQVNKTQRDYFTQLSNQRR